MERLLASVRTLLIDAALESKDDIAPEMDPFSCALARQCFINEYVFHVSDVEREASAALRAKLRSELLWPKPILDLWHPAHCAMPSYVPLHHARPRAAILSRNGRPRCGPDRPTGAASRRTRPEYRAATAGLTAITDETSVLRFASNTRKTPIRAGPRSPRQQSESGIARPCAQGEFPAHAAARCRRTGGARHSDRGLRHRPAVDPRRRDVSQAARVLAIDLSLASLAYAQTQGRRTGLTNIEYAQADIVAFEPDRTFDVIEASGVLHHLADPMHGWSCALAIAQAGRFHAARLSTASLHARTSWRRGSSSRRGGYDANAEEHPPLSPESADGARSALAVTIFFRRISTASAHAVTCYSTCRNIG